MGRTAELKEVERRLAGLALAQLEQEEFLNVRQYEQMRRGLMTAGDELGWADIETKSGDPVPEIKKALLRMCKNGARAIAKDLAEELAIKKKETKTLAKLAESLHKMAESKKTEFPVLVTYEYTARDSSQNQVTKTQELELNEASEIQSAADGMDRSAASREKLANLMVIALKARGTRIEAMTERLPEYVESMDEMIREVLATLQ
jgi:hypothetical protein